jgi:TolB protein
VIRLRFLQFASVVVVLAFLAFAQPILAHPAADGLQFQISGSENALPSPPPISNPSATLRTGLEPSISIPTGRLIVSAESGGTWNIFTADPNSHAWQKLATERAAPARDPAISPDGRTIAFRSKRDGTWDIYAMSANGSNAVTRLTRSMVYSGAPVWSPDGKRIAFESYARGDLDIWVMNADGTQPIDLTDNEKTHDYAPAWSPDGKWLAFTSWRTGTQQIFAVAADCKSACKAINLSQTKNNDQEPAWSPDGNRLAFVSDRAGQRAIYVADFVDGRNGTAPQQTIAPQLKNARRVTFSGWDDQPAWSPDGKWLAFVSVRPTRQPIYITAADGSGIPHIVENGPSVAASVTWAMTVIAGASEYSNGTALYKEQPDLAPANSGHPYDFRRVTSIRLDSGLSRLNGRVADSLLALQTRVKQEAGYDFFAIVSDLLRPLDYRCDNTCDTLSWHKSGRAVDTRLDYNDPRGIGGLEVVREDQQGETFWRMYLKTAVQDGTQGEPLKDAPWDFSYRARWVVGKGEGGTPKPVPYGFYVDFTELARQYGWERISSADSEDLDWKTNKLGAEYWHYQKMQGLNWHQAMREMYSESDLKSLADWNTLARAGYAPYVLFLKGIPMPPAAWRWNVVGP